MNRIPHCLFVMTLACLSVLGDSPAHASDDVQSEARTSDPIPVVLTAEPDSTSYPQPNCSKCRRIKVESQTSSTGETRGVLELTYFDEAHAEFEGTIELTVLLEDDTERVVSIEDVLLIEGEEAQWVLDVPSEWSWHEVDMVWLELVPAE